MSRLTSIALVFTLVLASLSVSQTARACKCMVPEVPAARADATAVFEGRVVSMTDEKGEGVIDRRHVTLAVVRTWKGLDRNERIEIVTNGSSAACGYTFAADASYLVYARENEGVLSVSGCSRTRPLADAADDLAQLGAGSTPVAIGDKSNAGQLGASDAGTSSSAAPLADAGVRAPSAAPPPVPRTRSGGCAGGRSGASAAYLLALPAVGMVLRRRKRNARR